MAREYRDDARHSAGSRDAAARSLAQAFVHTFVKSECDEVAVRIALSDAALLYRDAPEAAEAKGEWDSVADAFMREVLPGRPKAVRDLASDIVTTTLGTVGKEFSEEPRTPSDLCRRHGRHVLRLPEIATALSEPIAMLALYWHAATPKRHARRSRQQPKQRSGLRRRRRRPQAAARSG